jgi:hypothetical protein
MNPANPANYGRLDPTSWRDYPDHYTIPFWPDVLPSSPKDYGSNEFHGRTHPEIIKVALERYTKEGDLAWDPFAGSGTTIDVCNEFNTRCIASDIITTRDDIIEADATVWRPDEQVDLIICHPPYMDIIDYYSVRYENTNLATSDIGQYRRLIEKAIENMTHALKQHRVLVMILGSVYKDAGMGTKDVIPLDSEIYPYLIDAYRMLGRVVRSFGETKGGATSGRRRENLWKQRRFSAGLWGLGVDTVTYWAKR